MTDEAESFARYHRQMLLPGIGETGQQRLRDCTALLVGCGALGTVIADALTRAGIGRLVIVDRDVVEITNLQRQVLFDERDVEACTPKALAAKAKLQSINRGVAVDAHVDDFNGANAARYVEGVDLILDGLDNFETRYLLNDLAVSRRLPYVYGGAVGTTGMSMTVLPGNVQARRIHQADSPRRASEGQDVNIGGGDEAAEGAARIVWSDDEATPCLRCVFPDPPPPGASATCDTAGVLGPVVSMVAAQQASEAIKLMTGNISTISRSLLSIDVWSNRVQQFDVSNARSESCPCCGHGEFDSLEGGAGSMATSLCGRGAVQVNPMASSAGRANGGGINLAALADRLQSHGTFTAGDHLLRGTLIAERGTGGAPIELLVFPNGRAIIKGTDEPDRARTIYAKYIGT
jgi:molybdopterin-synthase adenylyltransferase